MPGKSDPRIERVSLRQQATVRSSYSNRQAMAVNDTLRFGEPLTVLQGTLTGEIFQGSTAPYSGPKPCLKTFAAAFVAYVGVKPDALLALAGISGLAVMRQGKSSVVAGRSE